MIRDACQEDLDYVKEHPLNNEFKRYPDTPLSGWAKTLLIGDDIVAVGGIMIFWEGYGEAWVQLSEKAALNKVVVILKMRLVLKQAIEELNLHRLEVHVNENFKRGIKMVKALGFKFETKKEKYAPDGSNVNSYVMVK